MRTDMRPAVEIDQTVGFLTRGLIHGIEVTGDHQPPRPAVVRVCGELPGALVDTGMAGPHHRGPAPGHHETDGVRADEHPQPPLHRAVTLVRGEHPPRGLLRLAGPRTPRTRPDPLC